MSSGVPRKNSTYATQAPLSSAGPQARPAASSSPSSTATAIAHSDTASVSPAPLSSSGISRG